MARLSEHQLRANHPAVRDKLRQTRLQLLATTVGEVSLAPRNTPTHNSRCLVTNRPQPSRGWWVELRLAPHSPTKVLRRVSQSTQGDSQGASSLNKRQGGNRHHSWRKRDCSSHCRQKGNNPHSWSRTWYHSLSFSRIWQVRNPAHRSPTTEPQTTYLICAVSVLVQEQGRQLDTLGQSIE